MDILQRVKIELKLKGILDISDDVIEYLIERVKQSILNYCNIWDLPDELEYLLAVMVADSLYEAQGVTTVEGSGKVSSVSEGGRTVSFDVQSKVLAASLTLCIDNNEFLIDS